MAMSTHHPHEVMSVRPALQQQQLINYPNTHNKLQQLTGALTCICEMFYVIFIGILIICIALASYHMFLKFQPKAPSHTCSDCGAQFACKQKQTQHEHACSKCKSIMACPLNHQRENKNKTPGQPKSHECSKCGFIFPCHRPSPSSSSSSASEKRGIHSMKQIQRSAMWWDVSMQIQSNKLCCGFYVNHQFHHFCSFNCHSRFRNSFAHFLK